MPGLVAALTALAPATAGAGAADYGDLNLVYIGTTTNWSDPPGRTTQSSYNQCGEPSQPGLLVGSGGYLFTAGDTDVVSDFPLGKGYNASIHPVHQIGAPEPDSTQQVADNLFTVDNDLTLGENAVCGGVGEASYPQADKASPKRKRTRARVSCQSGTRVLGGGGSAPGPFRSQRLVSSAPFDSGDAGKSPDDGWRIAVDNLGKKNREITVYAICSPVESVSYVSKAFEAKKRSRRHSEVDCPAGEFVMGGGVTHSAAFGKGTLVASRYGHFPDFDSWITEVDNLSRKRTAGKAFAICHS